jgi:SAM-dependent methyltransferase
VRYVRARAERLPFADETFDVVFSTLSLRHWTDPWAGFAEIGRVLTAGGVLILADVFRSCPDPGPAAPMRRRHPVVIPAEVGGALDAHRLAVIGYDRTRWFRLPDVQVIAARKPARAQDAAAAGPGAGPQHAAGGVRGRGWKPAAR